MGADPFKSAPIFVAINVNKGMGFGQYYHAHDGMTVKEISDRWRINGDKMYDSSMPVWMSVAMGSLGDCAHMIDAAGSAARKSSAGIRCFMDCFR